MPAAVAGAASIVVLSLFFTSATRRTGDPVAVVFVCPFAVLTVIGVVAGAASVRALRHDPKVGGETEIIPCRRRRVGCCGSPGWPVASSW